MDAQIQWSVLSVSKACLHVGPYIPLTFSVHENLDVTIGGPRLVSGKLPVATLEANGKLDVWVGARIKVPVFITMIPTYPNYQPKPIPIIMEENGSLQYWFLFSFRVIFHFHDYGRKGR